MRELTERDIQQIVASVPLANLQLFLTCLQGHGNKVIDRSKNAYNGTMYNCTWKRTIRGLWVHNFDKVSDYIVCANPTPNLNFTTQPFTVNCWIYPTSLSSSPQVFSRSNNINRGHYFQLGTTKMTYYSFQVGHWDATDSTNIIVLNTWQMVSVTRLTTVVTIYRNGVDVTNTHGSHVDPATDTIDPFTIGALAYNPDMYEFGGQIGLFNVHNTNLSAAQLLSIYNRQRHLFGV